DRKNQSVGPPLSGAGCRAIQHWPCHGSTRHSIHPHSQRRKAWRLSLDSRSHFPLPLTRMPISRYLALLIGPRRQSTPHSRCHQDLTDYQKMQCPSSHNPQRYFLLRLICILPDCAPSPFLYILICRNSYGISPETVP